MPGASRSGVTRVKPGLASIAIACAKLLRPCRCNSRSAGRANDPTSRALRGSPVIGGRAMSYPPALPAPVPWIAQRM